MVESALKKTVLFYRVLKGADPKGLQSWEACMRTYEHPDIGRGLPGNFSDLQLRGAGISCLNRNCNATLLYSAVDFLLLRRMTAYFIEELKPPAQKA
jgi:hypothetical protein